MKAAPPRPPYFSPTTFRARSSVAASMNLGRARPTLERPASRKDPANETPTASRPHARAGGRRLWDRDGRQPGRRPEHRPGRLPDGWQFVGGASFGINVVGDPTRETSMCWTTRIPRRRSQTLIVRDRAPSEDPSLGSSVAPARRALRAVAARRVLSVASAAADALVVRAAPLVLNDIGAGAGPRADAEPDTETDNQQHHQSLHSGSPSAGRLP